MSLDQVWVAPSGPQDAIIAYVGEGPGREEAIEGEAFVGPSGQILWPWSEQLAGVTRPMVRVTNWHKTMLTKELKAEYEKSPELAQWWTDELLKELRNLPQLRVVVALGAFALRAVLPPEAYNLYWANGLAIPHPTEPWVIIPVGHPAAGMHESSMLERTWTGLQGLGRYLRTRETWGPFGDPGSDSTRWPPVPSDWRQVAIDTEGTPGAPFCLSFSIDPRQSTVIYATDKRGLAELQSVLQAERPAIYLHNAVWDLDVLTAMGINLAGLEIRDTALWANLLQDEPRDLKSLARRHLAIPMTDYAALVKPYQEEAIGLWRDEAFVLATGALAVEQEFTPKGKPRLKGGKPVYRTVGPQRELKIHTYYNRGFKFPLAETKWLEAHIGPMPGLDLSLVPASVHVPYAGKDARVTLGIAPILKQRVEAAELTQVAALDHAVQPLIQEMQSTGMHLDPERYHEVMAEVSETREALIAKLRSITGRPDFNPGSSDQVEETLREHEYELVKKTASGKRYSTNESVLRILKEEYGNTDFLDSLLQYREHDKYLNTYLLPLGQEMRETADGWRMFHRFGLPTVSGRLTGRVLTWPAKTKLGRRLRSIFDAPPGKVLVAWDLSQIELRLAAAFARDPVMTEAFLAGRDLHANLASNIFHRSYEECLVEPGKTAYRYPAKAIHYLLLYGGGGATLYEELRVAGVTGYSLEACYELLDSTWRTYKVTGIYLRSKARQARETGYVTDFLGRRRLLPGASLEEGEFGWALRKLRLEAERQAGNYDIQGSAAEIIKRAMVVVRTEVYPQADLRLWLQLHDELMGESTAREWERLNRLMVDAMTRDSALTAPIRIETEGKMGATWDALK